MKISQVNIKIKELIASYSDKEDDGVTGYGGKLNIRPPYQRNFVYEEKEKLAVIDTVQKGYPLNVMYWVEDVDGNYEVLDGQQRTMSICQYSTNCFSLNQLNFDNLTSDKKKDFLEYELMIYICKGTESEKLEWFKIINIAGLKLKEQELRNAIYTGPWLSDAKKYFSRNNCVAYQKGSRFLDGDPKRQDYLETALDWKSEGEIEKYMSNHQNNKDANELWQYFSDVINWVEKIFPLYRKTMKTIEWGFLYNKYKDKSYNSNDIEKEVSALFEDEEVSSKKGIYEYVLSKNEKFLHIRTFNDNQKAVAFEKQKKAGSSKAHCPKCDKTKLFDLSEMEADHIVPWSKGGKTALDNCQMLCKYHNGIKSNN